MATEEEPRGDGCQVMAAERPQLLVTNLMVASAMLSCFWQINERGSVPYSEVYLQYGARREVHFRPGAECPDELDRLAARFFTPEGALRVAVQAVHERAHYDAVMAITVLEETSEQLVVADVGRAADTQPGVRDVKVRPGTADMLFSKDMMSSVFLSREFYSTSEQPNKDQPLPLTTRPV